jgi:hypothetical protein
LRFWNLRDFERTFESVSGRFEDGCFHVLFEITPLREGGVADLFLQACVKRSTISQTCNVPFQCGGPSFIVERRTYGFA